MPRIRKTMQVTMPDESVWSVPVDIIAVSRADYYAHEFGDDIERSLREDTLPLFKESPSEITDWAEINMDWKDIAHLANEIQSADTAVDYQEGWVNGNKDIVDI